MVALALAGCSQQGNSVNAKDAATHVGSTRTVCDIVADVRVDPVSTGPLYLDLVRPAPDQALTIVIQDRASAGALRYLGHEACASGLVEATGDKPRVVVRTPAQVHLTTIKADEVNVVDASQREGQVVTVCDRVAAYRVDPASELVGYLDFVSPEPDTPLVVRIDDRRQIPDAKEYPGRTVCITGYLTRADGKMQMTLKDSREASLK